MNKERGSVVIIVSFCIVLFITILAFIVNVGYLSATKNIYENAAEAAAMAGAARLCDGDAIEVAKQIAKENGVDPDHVTVQLGFYDVENEKFYPEGSIPEGEYINAVMVSISSDVPTILGTFLGKEKTKVLAKAVAYAETCGFLALGEDSEIRIGPSIYSWKRPLLKNGVIYSNGDIKLGKGLSPQFEKAKLYAHNQVLECETTSNWSGPVVHWDSCSESGRDNAHSNAPKFSGVRRCDDAYIDSLIQSLKNSPNVKVKIYKPDDAGSDSIFFKKKEYQWGRIKTEYYFDLCAEKGARQDRVVYIFDAEDDGQSRVLLTGAYQRHGNYIENVTFITKLPVTLDYNESWRHQEDHVGAEGDKQFILITSKDLEIAGYNLFLEGAVFRIGGSFSPCYATHIPDGSASLTTQKVRIIADGNIYLWKGQSSTQGIWTGTINFKFGPPCPVLKVHLGKL